MAQYYLTTGETGVKVGSGSNQVTGTNGLESVDVTGNGDATFDASFARGGDVINIDGLAGDYTASRIGNFLKLTSATGADIRIPIGDGAGAIIKFADAPARVLTGGATITLGTQVIASTGNTEVADGSGSNPGTPSNELNLTANQDILDGTGSADLFLADMVQVNGLQVNTLGTGDNIRGGSGNDELDAQITRAATFSGNGTGGNNSGSNIPVQPRIDSVEEIHLEALNADLTSIRPYGGSAAYGYSEGSVYSNNTEVYFNAKNVRGHNEIWSYQSDANLTVQDLTTIVAGGTHDDARNTSDITIGMGYTSGQDTFWDSSDYKVFFDQDFLLTGQAAESRANFFLLDEDAEQAGLPRLSRIDVDGIRFSINGGPSVTLSDPDAQLAGTHAGFVAALQDALQLLIAQGKVPADTTLFVDPTITDFTFTDNGTQSGPIPAITLQTQTNAVITPLGFSRVEDAIGDYDVYGRFTSGSNVEDLPLSVNIALEKVGRGGEGGDLIVGSMDKYHHGIDVFDVTVYGDKSRPSWLDYLNSTGDSYNGVGRDGELDVINIVSDNENFPADTWADLTIGATNDNLTTIDAQEFFGDLTLGVLVPFQNLKTLLATGGGDVTFYGHIDNAETGAYSYLTGAGDDLVDLSINGRSLEYATSSLDITTGDGADEVYVSYDWNESELPNHIILNNVAINTGEGADIISTIGQGRFRINAGNGNDVVYSEQRNYYQDNAPMSYNSQQTAHWVFNVDRGDYADEGGAGSIDLDSLPGVPLKYSLLNGATVTVTFSGAGNTPGTSDGGGAVMEQNGTTTGLPGLTPADPVIGDAIAFKNGYESTRAINLSNNPLKFYGTQVDINKAIMSAINDDPVLNKLLLAEIGANNTLVVSSKIDGEFVTEDLDIAINRSPAYASTSTTVIPSALITEALQLGYVQPGQIGTSTSNDDPADATVTPLLTTLYGSALDNAFYSGVNNSPDASSVDQFNNLWSSGGYNGDQSDHFITGGAGNDVIVLSTDHNALDNNGPGGDANEYWTLDGYLFDRASNETLVYNGANFGTDSVVNFQTAGVEDYALVSNGVPAPTGVNPVGGFDFLDFTAYLTSKTSTVSGSQSVTRTIATSLEDRSLSNTDGTALVAELNPDTLVLAPDATPNSPAATDTLIDANEVYIVSFDNSAPGTSSQTFAGLTDAVVTGLINGTAITNTYGSLDGDELDVNRTYVNSPTSIQLVNGDAHAILMIQNADNLGEYKVFEVTWNGLASANTPNTIAAVATLRGTIDFGTSIDGIDELNLVGSLEHSLFNIDVNSPI